MSALGLGVASRLEDGQPGETWDVTLAKFIDNLFVRELSQGRTAQQLLALFDTPENLGVDSPEFFYYHACDEFLSATREHSEAGAYISLLAELFALLRTEGFKRDPDQNDGAAVFTMMTIIIGPTLRELGDDMPVPPGYMHNEQLSLEEDPDFVQSDSFQDDVAEYARKHEGQLRFWSFVGRLDSHGLFGTGARGLGIWPLLFHQGRDLLPGLENPVNLRVWETLWAAVLHCEDEMGHGQWGSHANSVERLAGFKDAARTIAMDDRVSLLWRGRFALMLECLAKKK